MDFNTSNVFVAHVFGYFVYLGFSNFNTSNVFVARRSNWSIKNQNEISIHLMCSLPLPLFKTVSISY